MKNNKILWIIGIVLVVILINQPQEKKEATAATQSFSKSTVGYGETITATYHPSLMNYFGVILDVPSGWTANKAASPDGKIRTTADGSDITITWTAPSQEGNYNFDGQYFVYPDSAYTPFTRRTIQVVNCVSHSTYSCDGGDVYYFDSCGAKEDKKTECGTSGDSGSNFCQNGDVYKNYVTRGCSGNSCTESTNANLQQDCGYDCSGSQCVGNTNADTDMNGCISDSEFPGAVSMWKNQNGISDSEFPTVVSKWKNQENC